MTPAGMVPSGAQWAREIKHDGFRFICRRHRDGLRVFSWRAVLTTAAH
jgi:ATP-dependent DNA ligase